MEALTLFLWGENLELLGFLVVVGGYLKKRLSVLSLCFIVLVMVLFKLALSMSD
ncbi:hypothetical protein [Helicobacter pylori]|uniref:hypothetical protein n=1 Tax=Helicobacter pylori TaxID=210 RepID=UPI0013DDD435|nr:hypothetical protein [Helicobacter pylori]